MNDNEASKRPPVSVVRFGLGKEIQLYHDEFVVTTLEEGREIHLPLHEIKRLTLMPGDPNPSKLILMADLEDETTVILAEGMSNARGFRELLPRLQELHPDILLDPPDMGEQLRQALNNRRAWTLTCYGTIILICLLLYGLYMLVAFLGSHH
jgi:hypothetical protein